MKESQASCHLWFLAALKERTGRTLIWLLILKRMIFISPEQFLAASLYTTQLSLLKKILHEKIFVAHNK
jgi:hypothetical protein